MRREEVSLLAGVSVDYYTRLERGNASGVSESVLGALARALKLDEAERTHLFDLARAAHPTARTRRRSSKQQVRPSVQRVLDAMKAAPAFVRNGRMNILAANVLGRALYSEVFAAPGRPVNTSRFIFLDPRAPSFYIDWESVASEAVAILRSQAGRDPYDRHLPDLVGELSTQSQTFRTRWAAHNVRFHDRGIKRLQHLCRRRAQSDLRGDAPAAEEGLTMFAYTAERGSRSEEALSLLASWAATVEQARTVPASDTT